MYCSFDLILKDFVTRYGTYEYSNRDKDLLILWFSVSDGQDSCHTFLKTVKILKKERDINLYTASEREC